MEIRDKSRLRLVFCLERNLIYGLGMGGLPSHLRYKLEKIIGKICPLLSQLHETSHPSSAFSFSRFFFFMHWVYRNEFCNLECPQPFFQSTNQTKL